MAELNKEVARLKAQADKDIARFEAAADAAARRCNQEVHRLKRAAVLKSEEVQAIEAAAKKAVARLQETLGELGGEVEDLKAKREEDAQRHAALMADLREANERLVKANEESLQTITLLREEMRVKDRELQQQARELEKRELLLQMKDQQLLYKDAALAAAAESAKVLQTAMRNQTHRSAGHVAAAEKTNADLKMLQAEHLALQQKTERFFYVMVSPMWPHHADQRPVMCQQRQGSSLSHDSPWLCRPGILCSFGVLTATVACISELALSISLCVCVGGLEDCPLPWRGWPGQGLPGREEDQHGH